MKALMIPGKACHNVVVTTILCHRILPPPLRRTGPYILRPTHTTTTTTTSTSTAFSHNKSSYWKFRHSSSVASIVVTAAVVDDDESTVDNSMIGTTTGSSHNHHHHQHHHPPNTNHPNQKSPLQHHTDYITNRNSIQNDTTTTTTTTTNININTATNTNTNTATVISSQTLETLVVQSPPTPPPLLSLSSTSPPNNNNNNNNNIASTSPSLLHSTTSLLDSEALRIPLHPHQDHHSKLQPSSSPPSPSVSEILNMYDQYLQERTSCHFGYPYNLQFDYQVLTPLLQYSINNLGDPYISSNYGVHSRQFEVAVIDYFAQLWKMDGRTTGSTGSTRNESDNIMDSPDYWGYVTASGTEGNLHGILLARECFPDGILYTSQETHYSVFKAARYYRMECQIIPTLPNGEINYDILATTIRRQRKDHDHNSEKPIILNVNIGTTVKGAIDNIDRIVQILERENIPREKFYIHCDGALFAMMIPYMTQKNTNPTEYSNIPIPVISFATQPIDSIAVSGHKMLGCPMPCGVALCRREHIIRLGQPIDYLNSIDTTIMGSRNGHAALYLWYALRTKGSLGIQEDVNHCIDTAQYLQQRLIHDVNVPCGLNAYSSTVVFERPVHVPFIQKWQLACSDDIAHVVVMPNITRTKIDQFIQEFIITIQTHGRIPSPSDRPSPLGQQLPSKLW